MSRKRARVQQDRRAPGSAVEIAVPIVLAAVAIAVRWIVLRATHSTTEDFYITLRYAENIAAGRGFVYNPGEQVLGTTTPLYTLHLALAAHVQLDPTTVGKSLNILADGITVWLICRLGGRLGLTYAGWIGGLLYATTSAPISISIGGMETALVTCVGTASILAYVEKRPIAFSIYSAILMLFRLDGLLLTVILAVAWLLQQRKRGLERKKRIGRRELVIFAVLILPWLTFAVAYFGSILPASMVAKLSVYERIRPGILPNQDAFRTQFASGPVQWVFLTLFVLGLVWVCRHQRPIRAVVLWLAAYYAAMLLTRVPAFAWYFLPPLPVYYLCVGAGLIWIASQVRPRVTARAAAAVVAVLALPLLWHTRSITRDIAAAQRLEDEVRRPLGEWLAGNAASSETVMLEPIGYIGYYSGLRVLDMIGLVSPEVIPCYRREEANPMGCIVDRFKPDWLVLRRDEVRSLTHPGPLPNREGRRGEGGSRRLRGEYRWVRSFPDPVSGPAFEVYRRDVP